MVNNVTGISEYDLCIPETKYDEKVYIGMILHRTGAILTIPSARTRLKYLSSSPPFPDNLALESFSPCFRQIQLNTAPCSLPLARQQARDWQSQVREMESQTTQSD